MNQWKISYLSRLCTLCLLCCVRKWRFRKRTVVLCVLIIVFIIAPLMLILMYIFYFHCSDLEVQRVVDTMCTRYRETDALGNLCTDLCETKSLKPINCVANHLGKDIVFEAVYNKRLVVLKSSKLDAHNFDQIYWTDDDENIMYPNNDVFYDMLYDSVRKNLNVSLSERVVNRTALIEKLWTGDVLEFKKFPLNLRQVVMKNIWFLIQQTEYLFLKYHGVKNVFPQIIGTCGHFYVEEFVQPLDNYFLIFYPAWNQKFDERAKLALDIIHYLENLEEFFPTLQLCDIKTGHFGLDAEGNVKLLDMDMVFFEPVLIQNMVAIRNCTEDEDCSFIDCLGSCNIENGECQPVIRNDNFQRICMNIFSGKVAHKYFGLLGLPPKNISSELQVILQNCFEIMNNTMSKYLRTKLDTFLTKVIL